LSVGSWLGGLVKDQPFVDVKVDEIKMVHGTWSPGTRFDLYLSIWPEDEKGRRIGALSRTMWVQGMESSEPLLWELIPDADKRKEFIRQAQTELANPDSHVHVPW